MTDSKGGVYPRSACREAGAYSLGVVSPLHPDKAQLEPVGFPHFFVHALDEFLGRLFSLCSLRLGLHHDRMLLKVVVGLGVTPDLSVANHLKLTTA